MLIAKKKSSSKNSLLLYGALAVTVIVAVYLNTQPPPTTSAHHLLPLATPQQTTQNSVNLTPQDLAAHFPRYKPKQQRDPFAALMGGSASSADNLFGLDGQSVGGTGVWQLTGINSVNGVPSALIENSSTGQSIFLQPGDTWNGLRVVGIAEDTVTFQNGLGQQTTLGFSSPKAESTPGASASGQPLAAVPSLASISPLPPLAPTGPDVADVPASADAQAAATGYGRRGRRRGGFGAAGAGQQF